ncbi:Fic family protein [Treponema primitia]|uniref:Fic/DOC family protein n=1 Tax=Treponema primitia TaxID=88058 RepID=UPI003980389C
MKDISDRNLLTVVESFEVSRRLVELSKNHIPIEGSKTLLDIHKYIFQDIYQWAGEKRTVNISKQDNPFFPITSFDTGFSHIDTLIRDYRKLDATDIPAVSHTLAVILDSINYLHPFREGNGRTQREFLRVLALEKGYPLDLSPSDNENIYKRYMSGTIDGDIEKLTKLIQELLIESDGTN